MIKIFAFGLLMTFLSCGKGKLLTAPDYVHNPTPIDVTKLNFDGFYSRYDKKYPHDRYMALLPIIFKKKNKIFIDAGGFTVERPMICSDFSNIKNSDLGTYIIIGNEIIAFVPTNIAFGDGAYYKTYSLNYKGYIKNRDTIINFHAVPPFPNKFDKAVFNSSHNTSIFEPQTYIYIENDTVHCLKAE